jgi:hypothetical protein
VGLLPPDLAWRGADGFFAGGGVHVPWRNGDAAHGFDLRGGAYFDGGAVVDGRLWTSATDTHVRWDDLHGNSGVTVLAHGATAIANGARVDSAAWDVDALRGARAVQATTDLDAAAKPFDRATAQAAWRPDGWIIGSQVRAVALRGSFVLDDGVAGPVLDVRRAGAIANAGAYDVTFEGGQLAGGGFGATSFAQAEGGALLAARFGAVGASLALRGLGDVADNGEREGVDGVAQLRAALSLPLAGEYASEDASDPWVHRTEPRLEGAVVAAQTDGVLVVPAGRGAPDSIGAETAWITAVGWTNTVGRSGSRAGMDIDVAGGTIGEGEDIRPLLRAVATMGGPWLAFRADFARVLRVAFLDAGASPGGALIASARVGPASGLHVAAHAAERDGVDPYAARALLDVPFEAASGFLSAPGWTGGAGVGIPFGPRITVRGGADVDLQAGELVAALGSLELHDPCGCVVVRATAAHRIGREGIDAWVSVDLPTPLH